MSANPRIIRLFVASPGDVQRERDSLLGIVNELNRTCDWLLGDAVIRLELIRWETDTHPDAGRAQALITDQIGQYDIFLGIFWKRIGTPIGKAKSGTIEEFETAYARWQQTGLPHVAVYFNRAPIAPPISILEAEQLLGVAKFRERLSKLAFVRDYDGSPLFADAIRPNLVQIIGRNFLREPASALKPGGKGALHSVSATRLAGTPLTLTEMGPDDACYNQRAKYVGHSGTLIEAEERNGWLRGTFRFDDPLFNGDNRIYSFLQFRVESTAPNNAA